MLQRQTDVLKLLVKRMYIASSSAGRTSFLERGNWKHSRFASRSLSTSSFVSHSVDGVRRPFTCSLVTDIYSTATPYVRLGVRKLSQREKWGLTAFCMRISKYTAEKKLKKDIV